MANLANGFYQVNVGANPNDGTGDSFRDSFTAQNINWAVLGNTGLAYTNLSFNGSNISAPSGQDFRLKVNNAYLDLGAAGTTLLPTGGNIHIGGALAGQFLRSADAFGNVYWSNGATGPEGAVQYNRNDRFGTTGTFVYTEGNATLGVTNLQTLEDALISGDLTVANSANVIGQLSTGTFISNGDAVIRGNLTVFQYINEANAAIIELGAFVISLANTTNSLPLLDGSGITWGNTNALTLANTPNIRFHDIGLGSNIQQTVLSVYPGVWTPGLFISASATPVASNLAPGRVTFGPDTDVRFESEVAAVNIANARITTLRSTTSNIATVNGNLVDITSSQANGSLLAGRLLKIRNTDGTNSGPVGLQIVNANTAGNASWDIYNRAVSGDFVIGYSNTPATGSSANRLVVTTTGNIESNYDIVANNFMGFGPGNATHAGLVYANTGSAGILTIEATGANDSIQLRTTSSVAPAVTITANVNYPSQPAGWVGIGTQTPVSITHINSIGANRLAQGLTLSRQAGPNTGSYTLGIGDSNNTFFLANSSTGTTAIFVDGSRNIGLSTESPVARLDTVGQAQFRTTGTGPNATQGNSQALRLLANSSLDHVDLQFVNQSNANVWALRYTSDTGFAGENQNFWIYQNLNTANIKHLVLKYNQPHVGINVLDPLANLHVGTNGSSTVANVKIQSGNGLQLDLTAYPAYAAVGLGGAASAFPLVLTTSGANAVTVNPNATVNIIGNVYLGTSTSAGNLSDNDVYFYGNGRYLAGIVATGGNGTGVVIPSIHFSVVSNGSNQIFSNGYLEYYNNQSNAMSVYINGAYQYLGNYSISGSNLTIDTYLVSGDEIDVGPSIGNIVDISSLYSNSNVASYLASNANIQIITQGNITGQYFLGNGSLLTGITASGMLTVSNTAPVSPSQGDVWIQGNTGTQFVYFTSSGNSQWAEMEAAVSIDNSTTTYANSGYGNSNVAAYLASGTITGNIITTGNVSAGYVLGNGAFLTGISGGAGTYGNSNVKSYLSVFDGNIIANANATYDLGNSTVTFRNIYGNIIIPAGAAGNATKIQPSGIDTGISIVDAVSGAPVGVIAGNIYGNVLEGNTLLIYGNANINGTFSIGNLDVSNGNITVSILNLYPNASISYNNSYVQFKNSSDPNIFLDIEVANIQASGNIDLQGEVVADGNITANYFFGNGAFLTGISGGNYSNSNVANYLPTYNGNLISLTGNIITTANVSANYFLGNGRFLTGTTVTGFSVDLASTAIGLYANNAVQSTSIGYRAGNTGQGQFSTAVGQDAGRTNQGQSAVAIGNEAGSNTQFSGAVAVGYQAGLNNQNNYTVAIGFQAGTQYQASGAVAIGQGSGETNQGQYAIAIGQEAGKLGQGQGAIAIGYQSAANTTATAAQGPFAIAVGRQAGQNQQRQGAIAIGYLAAQHNQGLYSIAIGQNAGDGVGNTGQPNNSIVISASGSNLQPNVANTLFINPIRNDSSANVLSNTNIKMLFYNTVTKEIVWGNIS
jgi:cytoskeletal protein CcmA (bactofilin family)